MQSLGRYQIVELIGSGAMGRVYKARDPLMGRDVALKTILPHATERSQYLQFRERFFREAQAAGRLMHPGIVTVYDVSEHEGTPFLVMEYIDGQTLQSVLQSAGRLDSDRFFHFGIQMAEALHYAHDHGVVHRDIKPANILITRDGYLKIADFGIAKLVESHVTSTGQILGTPAFMAPEQFTAGTVDRRSDLFSAGVLLYWMATGNMPFTGDDVLEIQYKIVHTLPAPPRQFNPALSRELEAVILKSIAKDPAERYQSADECARDLRALRSNSGQANTPAPNAARVETTLPLETGKTHQAKEGSGKLDRTWLCSVVFVEIIKYSRQSLELQTQWKARFTQYLGDAIRECPELDRVILDTGDGAAVCFLADPEMAMFCALRLNEKILGEENRQSNPLQVRTGINLGSVKLVKDINGNLNAVGDGINGGRRVMSFAEENQILVSRSFYEIASSLSDSYAPLFNYEGIRTDKHLREHTVYELIARGTRRTSVNDKTVKVQKELPLSATQVAKLESSLMTFIGPIAQHLVRKARQQTTSIADLRQALVAFVTNPADQERFLHSCHDILPKTAVSTAPRSSIPTLKPEEGRFKWDPSFLERVRRELAIYIGPLARVLVDRAAAKAETPTTLYKLLAEEIPSSKDRDRFLKQAP